jgi:transcriptional regulator with XRE-family HTH domain
MRQRRESLGMSQGRLGRHLGLTFSQVQKYEKGANRIGAGRLFLLANFRGVPVHYFFDGLADTDALLGRNGDAGGELAALDDAFLSITDPETRQSVLALVSSLAQTRALGRPRRRVGKA